MELFSVSFRISVVDILVPLRWSGGCGDYILPGLKPWLTDIKLLRSFLFSLFILHCSLYILQNRLSVVNPLGCMALSETR